MNFLEASLKVRPGDKVGVIGFPDPLTVKTMVFDTPLGWQGDRMVLTLVDSSGNVHTRYHSSIIKIQKHENQEKIDDSPRPSVLQPRYPSMGLSIHSSRNSTSGCP